MSVAYQLGLDEDDGGGLLAAAERRWQGWGGAEPRLRVVSELGELRQWLRAADRSAADEVLLGLARLAATDGGDDPAAAAALAWALLPGACRLASQLRTLSPRIDEVVAAQLWVEVRTFGWRRLTKVAANVLCNTRAGVLRDCDAQSQLERADRTWARTRRLDPALLAAREDGAAAVGPAWPAAEAPRSPAEELLEVLDWAREHDVISGQDRHLLLCLVAAADQTPTRRTGRGSGGLMANEVSARVAERCGVSPATVRRRARRSMRALSAAVERIPA